MEHGSPTDNSDQGRECMLDSASALVTVSRKRATGKDGWGRWPGTDLERQVQVTQAQVGWGRKASKWICIDCLAACLPSLQLPVTPRTPGCKRLPLRTVNGTGAGRDNRVNEITRGIRWHLGRWLEKIPMWREGWEIEMGFAPLISSVLLRGYRPQVVVTFDEMEYNLRH